MEKSVLSALIGLAGAVNNNGKTETTDSVIRAALLSQSENGWIEKIHQEKFKVSPNCASCQSPCGNTSDYPVEAFGAWPDEQKALKEQIIDEMCRIAAETAADDELPDVVYTGIAYIGYDLEKESYRKLLEELKRQECP